MAQTDVATLILKVNGEDADKKLKKLQSDLATATKQKEDLEKKHAGGKLWSQKDTEMSAALTKKIASLNKQLTNTKSTSQQVVDTLEHLDKASPKNLRKTLKFLQQDLEKVERGSEEWKRLQHHIIKVKEEIEAVGKEQKAAMSMSDRFAAWGQKWMGIAEVVETTVESLTGLKAAAAEASQAFLEMDEAMANVKKYTELSDDAVKDLNETFKQMDTRTPREKLNALAADAGRLGINSKEAILDFVDAANMINVALGEDLGEDAVKNIGKLAQLFGNDEQMGLKQAMISTGSVINELAQTSSANEGYIMDFTARLAGMAKQANMSQADVMAYAAIMDQAMVNAEEGSTALMKVIQNIYRDPAKMAKAAGMEVEKFTTLVKTDANAALLQFAEAVSKMGGMEKVAPMLGDISLTGAGVSKTIATLANQVDKVRATQQQANAAFAEGKSVVNEFNAANNTRMAQTEKYRKKVQDLRIELGEKLQPVMQAGLSTGTMMMKLAIGMIEFTGKHIASIVALTAVIGAYVVAINAATLAQKAHVIWSKAVAATQVLMATKTVMTNLVITLFTKGLKAARIQFMALNTAMKTNIFGVLTAGLSIAIVSLIEFFNKEKEVAKGQGEILSAMDRIDSKVAESTEGEVSRIKKLTEMINSSAVSYDMKRRAMLTLQRIVPDFHANIGKEITLTNENTTAIQNYIKQLENKATAEAYYEEIVAQKKKIAAAKSKEFRKQNNVAAVESWMEQHSDLYESNMKEQYIHGGYGAGQTIRTEQNQARIDKLRELKAQEKAYAQAVAERKQAENELAATMKMLNADKEVSGLYNNLIINGSSSKVAGGGGTMSDDEIKKAVEKIKAAASAKKLVKRMEYESGIINYEDYSKSLLQIDVERFQQEKQLYAKNTAEWLTAENGRLDAMKQLKARDKDYSLNQIEVESKEEQRQIKQKYINGEMDHKEYEKQLTAATLRELKRRAAYLLAYAPGSKEQMEAQSEYQTAMMEDQLAKRQNFEERAKAFEVEYGKKSNEEKMQNELDFLNELVQKGVIAEDKKQDYIKAIREKYADGKDEKEEKSPLMGGMDAMSSSVVQLGTALDNLQTKIDTGKANWEDYAAVAQAAMGSVMAIMQSASQLMQANVQAEQAKIERRYDAEIKAAGGNRKKVQQLEKKKQEDIAKMKNKYAGKAMAMEIAMAIAQTSVAAINAYASASKVNWLLGPIAASMAVAAGMIQIAAIKKQHDAQKAGYYSGGYTGGSDYHREAGVVHEGEFVANHMAVRNPSIRPFFDLIDYAQQHNFVSSLRLDDVSQSVAAPARSASALADGRSSVVVQESERTTAAIERLNDNIEAGIYAKVSIAGEDGIDANYRKFNRLNRNKNA